MPNSHTDSTAKSILNGVNELIDSELGLKRGKTPRHKHKANCRFTEQQMAGFDASALISKIYKKVVDNREGLSDRIPSQENWRFGKQRRISGNNKSSEVRLERAIVNIPDEIWPDGENWANQVPVSSGLTHKADRRRAIDLVRRCGDGSYEFIELKVNEGAGAPLFAAMEILQYGILYLFSRDNAGALGYEKTDNNLLGATGIHLKVLAPTAYYEGCGYVISWLESSINIGLTEFLQREPGFKMDFKFESLSLIPLRSSVT